LYFASILNRRDDIAEIGVVMRRQKDTQRNHCSRCNPPWRPLAERQIRSFDISGQRLNLALDALTHAVRDVARKLASLETVFDSQRNTIGLHHMHRRQHVADSQFIGKC